MEMDHDFLIPIEDGIRFFGNSSDMTVYDLGNNPNNYEIGDMIRFLFNYPGATRLMHSRFIDKILYNPMRSQ